MLSNKQVVICTFFNREPIQRYTWDLEEPVAEYLTQNDAYALLKASRENNPAIRGKMFSIRTYAQTFFVVKYRGDYKIFEL